MARIEFTEPEAQLHGTFCGLTYRVINGSQHTHLQLPDPLPRHPTAADRERHRRRQVIMWAVGTIQMMLFEQGQTKSVERMQQLADQYKTFYMHAARKYDEWHDRFDDNKRFARAIAYWYVTDKHPPEFPDFR